MKRILLYLVIAALIILSGCRGSESCPAESAPTETAPTEVSIELDILLTAPPDMTVRCGDREASVGSGNYSWEYESATGQMQAVIACGVSPGSLWEGEPTMIADGDTAELSWIVMPDSITVRCWSNARSTETWDVEFTAEMDENILTLDPEYSIYEITAVWNSSSIYSGRASYAVFILPQE